MNKYEIVKRIEQFAPLETQEKWDCSGWLAQTGNKDVNKIMLALTVTENIINQAQSEKCDMIISHHPLFCVPLDWKCFDIYCAHTNMDLAQGGTTDRLTEVLGFSKNYSEGGFLRYVDVEISVFEFAKKLKLISPNLRYVNNSGVEILKKIGFCAGSGSEFITEAFENGADALVTGDIKFHTALESPVVLFDIGHFESEIGVLSVFEKLIGNETEIIYAKEESPFLTI